MLKNKKIVSLLMAIIIMVACFPCGAYSVDINNSVDSQLQQATTLTESNGISSKEIEFDGEPIIGKVQEVVSLREENVKHFRLNDGTYEAVVYASAVHRLDGEGNWKDIDNNLQLRKENETAVYSTNDSRVTFSSLFTYNSELFSLKENGYVISITPVNLGKLSAEITKSEKVTVKNSKNREMVFESVQEASRIDNKSSILYNNVRENVDLEYVLDGNNIKENIIINKASQDYSYSYIMNLNGLKATLDNCGNILITDAKTKEVKYCIPAPYMYDSNGEYSYNVSYNLKENTDGSYLFTLTADEAWINDDNRVYPVVIDPTIQGNIWIDTYIDSQNPNSSYANSSDLRVSPTQTALIKPYIPNLPLNISSIESATLYISYYGATESFLAGLYEVTGMITESTTYNAAPSISTARIGSLYVDSSSGTSASNPMIEGLIITQEFSNWYYGAMITYGIAIKYYTGPENTVYIRSSETAHSPYLVVRYMQQIPDGVYAIKNGYGTSFWMSVENSSTSAGANVQHKLSETSPVTAFDRSSLFKISGSNGMYIIRLMTNNNLTISVSGNKIVTKEIPSRDEDVLDEDKFYITRYGTTYIISPYGGATAISMDTVDSLDLVTVQKSTGTVMMKWSFEQYTGNHKGGVIMTAPSSWWNTGIVKGDSGTISVKSWSTYIDANIAYIAEQEGYEELIDISWDFQIKSGVLTATNIGKLKLKTIIGFSNGMVARTGNFSFNVIPREGIHYIRNAGTYNYIDIEGPSTANGAIIQQWQFHTGDQEKWEIEHVVGSGGYVRIKSVYSGLYIGVDPNNLDVIRQYAANDYTYWMLDRTSNGNLLIINRATENSGKVLAVPANQTSSGIDLIQSVYTEDEDCCDEWIVDKYLVVMYGIKSAGHDHESCLAEIENSVSEIEYYEAILKNGFQTANSCKADLFTANIFISRSHGINSEHHNSQTEYTGILLDEVEWAYFYSSSFEGMNSQSLAIENGEKYNNLQIAAFIGCETGANGENNLIAQIVANGARAAVGFEESIDCASANMWTELFYNSLLAGNTLEEAVEFASDGFSVESGLKSAVIFGDATVTIP